MSTRLPAGAASDAGGPVTHAEPCRGRQTYVRRQPEQSLLRAIVRDHLETFLAEAREREGGGGVPAFVERELREFLSCGVMARGFARFRCRDCAHEVLVAFSCKGRGFCPSCCGRRMAELAAHLVDGVLGGLPVRQWVLKLPHRLRYALAWDHRLCRAVLAVFVRAVLGFERRRGEREVLVAFSCKGRGFCPSCCGRRMAELSAHLVDGALGGLPVRQWVLTLPYRLRFALA